MDNIRKYVIVFRSFRELRYRVHVWIVIIEIIKDIRMKELNVVPV